MYEQNFRFPKVLMRRYQSRDCKRVFKFYGCITFNENDWLENVLVEMIIVIVVIRLFCLFVICPWLDRLVLWSISQFGNNNASRFAAMVEVKT